MSVSHLYTDFGSYDESTGADSILGHEGFEEEKLDAFEKGYQAGWEDAVKAHENDKTKVSADFAQNLQEMSFTYHEAIAKLTASLKPLLKLMVTKVLPELAQATLGEHVLEQVEKMAKGHMTSAIEIVVAPENLETLQLLMESSQITAPFELRAEPTLSSGQVCLRTQNQECEIDLDGVLRGISEAMNAFFHQSEKDRAHD